MPVLCAHQCQRPESRHDFALGHTFVPPTSPLREPQLSHMREGDDYPAPAFNALPTHKHGTEDGPGVACREYPFGKRRIGQCILDAARNAPVFVPNARPHRIDAQHLARQRDWSYRTFGPGPRTAGVLDHIRKELDEIAADPGDVKEWVDVVILAFDGALRAGHQPQEILDAIVAKQERNEGRTWPDWRTADPNKAIEHVRTEPIDATVDRIEATLHPNGRCLDCGGGEAYWRHTDMSHADWHEFRPEAAA